MSGKIRANACASVFALAIALGSTPAFAQEAVADAATTAEVEAAQPAEGAAEPAAEANAGDDTTIVVTAQKRSENVQDVPISIAAFSGDTLEKNNVVNIEGLAKVTPNLSVAKGAQTSYVRLAIRGIGAASNTTVEPSVAVFLDGAYVPRVGAVISSMLDMESVEVLRGPQGTLFGRNASVGAVSFHTARPKLGDFSGEVTGEIGNGDRYKLTGFVNVPVGENSAFRLAGSQQWFKGYWHNELDDEQVGGTDDTIVRGSFRTETGPLEWIVRADYAKISGDAATNIDFDRNSVSDAQWNFFTNTVGLGAPDTDLKDNDLNQFLTADVDDEQWGLNSTLSFDVGGGSTIRLINNYRDWNNEQLDGDVIFTPSQILSRTGTFDSKSQNHELQFISPTEQWLDGRLDLVAGLYYFHEKYQQGERLHMNSQFCKIAGAAVVACNNFLAANGGSKEDATVQEVNQKVDSYAAYAQANFHFTDQLFATVGGRFSKDKKEGDYDQVTNPLLAGVRAAESLTFPDVDDEKFTYRLGLNYEPNEDLLFFGSYSTGYKSAGYNSGAGSPSLTTIPVVPPTTPPSTVFVPERRVFGRETTENWELGAKTSWWNRRLTANLTFYRMDINGFQDRAFDGTSFTVRNAGNLRHQGFELDVVGKPLRNLSLFANVAYLDSEFTEYDNAPGLPGCAPRVIAGVPTIPAACLAFPNKGQTQDLEGVAATFAPKWSGRVGFDWTGDVGSTGMTFDLNSNASFVAHHFGGLQNDANPQTVIDGYVLLGARATLNGKDDRWSVSLFGNNLLDKQYEAGNLYQFLATNLGLNNGVFTGSTAVRRLHADPRTYGVSGTFRF